MGKTVTIDARSKKVNSKTKSSRSTNMASKKNKKSKDGRVLGVEIPVISPIIRNPTYRKVAMGAGTVAIALSIAQLINNDRINKALAKKESRILLAAAGGDIAGAAFQFFKEDGIKSLTTTTTTSTTFQGNQMFQQAGLA